MNIVTKAQVFATAAHAAVKHVRKYTGEPYIVHPIHVMSIVKTVEHTDAMLAAALLHDTVEDTGVTIDLIEQEFGTEVAELVGWLTDVSKKDDGNRAVRKQMDLEHTAQAPAAAQTIKLADLISNTSSIVKNDPKFAETYLKEKQALLKVLTKGDPALISWTHATLLNGQSVVEHNRIQESLKNMELKNERTN
jgi:(p)ppGpp synthase/HD superfamily hydrolase